MTTQSSRKPRTKAASAAKVRPAASSAKPPRMSRQAKAPKRKPAAPALAASNSTPAPPKLPGGKLGVVVVLLQRPEGATLAAMMQATGWQAHSVRGAMSGALKKKAGLAILSEVGETGRVYRIASDQA